MGVPALLREGHADADSFAVKIFLGATLSHHGEHEVPQGDPKTLGELHHVDAIQEGELRALDWYVGHEDECGKN